MVPCFEGPGEEDNRYWTSNILALQRGHNTQHRNPSTPEMGHIALSPLLTTQQKIAGNAIRALRRDRLFSGTYI